jgi:anti-sigma factor RsiW
MANGAEQRLPHFDVATGADFARDLLGAKDRADVEGHLTTCPECAATAKVAVRGARVRVADQQYEPSAEALEHARGLFAIERPRAIVTSS